MNTDRLNAVAAGLSALAAIASAATAYAAYKVATAERPTPYKVALYSARWASIQRYAEASANLSTALDRASINIPPAVDEPDTFAKMTPAELLAASKIARPMISAWGDYIEASSGALAPWSLKVNDAVSEAESAGRNAYECFRWLGAYTEGEPVTAGWWSYMKPLAAPYCQHIRSPKKEREAAFDAAARLVLRAMTDELREADSDRMFVPGEPHNAMD